MQWQAVLPCSAGVEVGAATGSKLAAGRAVACTPKWLTHKAKQHSPAVFHTRNAGCEEGQRLPVDLHSLQGKTVRQGNLVQIYQVDPIAVVGAGALQDRSVGSGVGGRARG